MAAAAKDVGVSLILFASIRYIVYIEIHDTTE